MASSLPPLKQLKQFKFESEVLKPFLSAFINNNFDIHAVPLALKKSTRLFIYDLIPYVWLSDGYHFIEAFFTKESINDFRKQYSHLKFSSLKDKVIYVKSWSMHVKSVPSKQHYTSYQNLTFYVVIEQFKPISNECARTKDIYGSQPMFKDEDIQTLIRYKRHEMSS